MAYDDVMPDVSIDRDALADLASAVVSLAREIESRNAHPDYVPLTQTERLVLGTLDRHGETAPSELAERLGLQRSNLSTALRGLETKGLVARRRSSPDGRGVLVRSTPLAAENLSRLRARWAEVLETVAPDASVASDAPDTVDLAATLQQMSNALVEQRRIRVR
ncbi:MarR family transcriptional regulator [Leucobacter sp. NPDC077196]|uniref:MarR family transcriptional regulator n=1 Tax=Leucobacter sp. NPDC077196 TaxID=3154959 RepID=UPI003438FC7F